MNHTIVVFSNCSFDSENHDHAVSMKPKDIRKTPAPTTATGHSTARSENDLPSKLTKRFGKKLDDILIHKNINYSSNVLKLLSDHFMVISEIEI